MAERWIRRFTPLQQAVHWIYALSFLLALGTGAILYVPAFSAYAVGEAGIATRFLHRLGAGGMILAALLYLLFGFRDLARDLGEILSWSREDRIWLGRAFLRYYWTGDRTGLPEEGRYNAGQKLAYLIQALGFLILAVTGLALWFGAGALSPGLLRLSLLLHDGAAVVTALFAVLHIYLTTLHPMTKPSITAMITGTVPEGYVQAHHPRWHREVAEGGAPLPPSPRG